MINILGFTEATIVLFTVVLIGVFVLLYTYSIYQDIKSWILTEGKQYYLSIVKEENFKLKLLIIIELLTILLINLLI